MSFEPKPISRESVPAALQKAERYRIINDPSSAESICLDVLTVDPENQQALVTLLLAITDQFPEGPTRGGAPSPPDPGPPGRRVQAGLLRRDHLRALRQSADATRHPDWARMPTTGSARR